MKGVYSSADDVLSRYTFVSLFPDSEYKNESGGDPEAIPQLKYEDFIKYHKEYYHPVNSYIYPEILMLMRGLNILITNTSQLLIRMMSI